MIKFIYKNDHHKTVRYLFSESRFDEKTMIRVKDDTPEEKEKGKQRMSEIFKSKSAPGMFMSSRGSEPSIMHNNKVDAGAVENLIDTGFEGAKKRIDVRKKKLGTPFIKRKNYKLRRKKR